MDGRVFQMLFCGLFALHVCSQKVPYTEKFFTQPVDHFNFNSKPYGKSTYQQRYLVQDKWWKKGSAPIFFYTGNEGDIVEFWDNAGFVMEIAPTFGALVIFAEHRYYGKSMPFDEKVVFEHPYIDLLTSEQALADYAVLLTYLKSELSAKDCPVIAFGGSYGGMLSAYMRMKYPNVIDGAIAASAPINLVAGVSDREFFFKIVTKDFAQAVTGCDTCVKRAFRDVHDLYNQGHAGQATIKKTFNLCKETSTQADYMQLLYWIRNSFVNLAMMDYPYPTSFLVTLPGNPVKVACQKMMQSQTAIQGLAEITELTFGNKSCHDIYKEYTACSDPTGCGTGVEGYPWDYQACTEFGMPAGTDGETDMFPALPFTLKQRDAYCKKRWGVTPRNYWAYVNYFGDKLQRTGNIVFSNGNLDPWHGGGVLKNISSSVVAVMIEGGAHHLDLRASNKADPPSVISARELEKQHIRKWISEHAKRGLHHEL